MLVLVLGFLGAAGSGGTFRELLSNKAPKRLDTLMYFFVAGIQFLVSWLALRLELGTEGPPALMITVYGFVLGCCVGFPLAGRILASVLHRIVYCFRYRGNT